SHLFSCFFSIVPSPPPSSSLSLHDALPICAYIVSGTANNTLHLWNATTGFHLFTHCDPFKTYAWTSSLAWSPDGEYIACGSDDRDRKSTRLNSSHQIISYAVFCLKKKKKIK